MAASRKVIVTCAVTGAIHTPSMSPYLPVTPEEIANAAIGAAEAGAAIVHLPARNPQTGEPDQTPEAFAKFLPVIKQRANCVVNITTGGAPTMSIEERVRPAATFKPEVASLNSGSMNFGLFGMLDRFTELKHEWERTYLADKNIIFQDSYGQIEYILNTCAGNGTRFEFECYDTPHLYNLKYLFDRGLVKTPLFLQMVFGLQGGIGSHADDVMHMRRAADRLFGENYRWSVLGASSISSISPRSRRPWAATCALDWKTVCGSDRANWPRAMQSRCSARTKSSRGSDSSSPHRTKRARSCRSRAATMSHSDWGPV